MHKQISIWSLVNRTALHKTEKGKQARRHGRPQHSSSDKPLTEIQTVTVGKTALHPSHHAIIGCPGYCEKTLNARKPLVGRQSSQDGAASTLGGVDLCGLLAISYLLDHGDDLHNKTTHIWSTFGV